jgi:hypothetical protein
MERIRTCPACDKVLKDEEIHRAKVFQVNPESTMTLDVLSPRFIKPLFSKRFWICDATIGWLEYLVKTYKEPGDFVNVP